MSAVMNNKIVTVEALREVIGNLKNSINIDELADDVLSKLIDRDPITIEFLSVAITKQINSLDMDSYIKSLVESKVEERVRNSTGEYEMLKADIDMLKWQLCDLKQSLETKLSSTPALLDFVSLKTENLEMRIFELEAKVKEYEYKGSTKNGKISD